MSKSNYLDMLATLFPSLNRITKTYHEGSHVLIIVDKPSDAVIQFAKLLGERGQDVVCCTPEKLAENEPDKLLSNAKLILINVEALYETINRANRHKAILFDLAENESESSLDDDLVDLVNSVMKLVKRPKQVINYQVIKDSPRKRNNVRR